jgi:solute carrier family 25 carnitine/acylcarnitine transporter 20/29
MNDGVAPVFTPLSFAAGYVAGAAGMLVGHPFDTLKVHSQTASTERLGLRALYRGWFGPVASYGLISSVALGLYENARRGCNRSVGLAPDEPTPLPLVGVASSTGVVVTVLTCPFQRIKVVQQLSGERFVPVARGLFAEGSLYRGFGACALIELSRVIYMPMYVWLKRQLGEGQRGSGPLPLWARVASGAGANLFCWTVIYPVDVIKSRQQAARPGGAQQLGDASMLACGRHVVARDGARGLYRGFGFTMLRAGPVAGVLLPFFDLALAFFQRLHRTHSAWTGAQR